MARKQVDHENEYYVTAIGYCVGGQVSLARLQAEKTKRLRSEIWNKYGSLQAWGKRADDLYKDFQETNPPSKYGLDFKQWQQTFNRVIDDIHAVQESVKTFVIRKIYRSFPAINYVKDEKGKVVKDKVTKLPLKVNHEEPDFRAELISSLDTLEWRNYPLIKRWVRQKYHRGHSWVNNQICVGAGNGATVKRKSRNIIRVTISGEKLPKGNRYEKLSLDFKVGRYTPKGNLRIIFRDETNTVELHYPKLRQKVALHGTGEVGLDKGYTEAFTGSDGVIYGTGIGKIMTLATSIRHTRGKARNRLWQLGQKKPHIYQCNLGKKRWSQFETKKRNTIKTIVRTAVNQVFDKFERAIVEDLSSPIKNKRQSKSVNRKLSEWCKKELQRSLEEISTRRKATVITVNAAYTSQVDHRNGTLLGARNGDQFFTFDGDVLSADYNASMNIKNRKEDPEITPFMKVNEVKKVLLKRTASFLSLMGLTLQDKDKTPAPVAGA